VLYRKKTDEPRGNYARIFTHRKIASSTLWQIGSQAAMAVLSILSAKFVAIGLSKELAGYYNSAYGYLQIFAILADFGLYAVAVREVSKAEDKGRVLGTIFVLRLAITLLSLGSAVVSVFIVPAWAGTPFPRAVAIASLVPFFTLLAGVLRAAFQVQYKMQFVFVAEVLQRVLTTLGMGVFILLGVRLTTDVRVEEGFLWIGGAGALLLFLVSFFYAERLIRIRPRLDWPLMKEMLRLAAPFGLAYLFITLYRQLDVVFVASLRPDFAVQNAAYGFAGRVEDMAFLIPTFLLNSTLPVLTERLAKKEDVSGLLGKTLFALLMTGSVFLLFSYFWSRPFTLLFATDHYLSTATVPGTDTAFRLMSLPMFLNGIVLFCFYVSLALHSWKRLIANFAVAVAFTIALNLLWTGTYGFVGAAWTLTIVHVLLVAALLPQTLAQVRVSLSLRAVTQWLLFSFVLAVLLFLTAPYLVSGKIVFLAGCASLPVLGLLAYAVGAHRTFRP
jgi:O-antigen/teichoic acid export membrane protein